MKAYLFFLTIIVVLFFIALLKFVNVRLILFSGDIIALLGFVVLIGTVLFFIFKLKQK